MIEMPIDVAMLRLTIKGAAVILFILAVIVVAYAKTPDFPDDDGESM